MKSYLYSIILIALTSIAITNNKKADSYSVKIPMIIRVTKKGAIFDCKCVFILLKSLLEVIAKICLS